MASLATVADLEARLGRSLTSAETIRAEALLDGASARVRTYTGQQFEASTTTARLRVRSGRITLPQRPVISVTSMADTNGTAVTFDWFAGDSIYLNPSPLNGWEIEPRVTPLGWVDVTYQHGYTTIPADVVEVVCQIVLRAFGQSADSMGLTSESLGSYSYSVGSAAASGAVGMLSQEIAALDVYRRLSRTAMVDW